MTAHRGFKDRVRARMLVTGEGYATAHAALVVERDRLAAIPASTPHNTEAHRNESAPAVEPSDGPTERTDLPHLIEPLDAIVLKVNRQSARVRIVGETAAITLRGPGLLSMIPGQIASIVVTKRWKNRGYEHATGAAGEKRIDIAALGLEPLPLEDHGLYDLRKSSEPFNAPDPYAPMWRTLTKPARRAFEFHSIAWEGVDAEADDDVETPVSDAAELVGVGDDAGAIEILMDVLAKDLRCIDAHAHLGNIEFRHDPQRALKHYEIGVGIGEMSLGPFFKDMLPWGFIYNRPFLRCLHGYGLTLWKLGRNAEALLVFERILALNPDDNQGVRFLLEDVRTRQSWRDDEARPEAVRLRSGRATGLPMACGQWQAIEHREQPTVSLTVTLWKPARTSHAPRLSHGLVTDTSKVAGGMPAETAAMISTGVDVVFE